MARNEGDVVTDELACAIAEEVPRARRRMWILLAVTLTVMAAMLTGALLLMRDMATHHRF
jgi:hypothetical protein